MIFLLDENFPRTAGLILEKQGHQIFNIRGTVLEGSDDDTVFRKAVELQAVFLTTDKDFYHTIPWKYDTCPGVIVIALSQPNSERIISRFEWALQFVAEKDIVDCCFLLTDTKFYTFSKR